MRKIPAEARTWLTTGEVADALRVDISTVRSWVDAGHLDADVLPSGHRRVSKVSVEKLKREMTP